MGMDYTSGLGAGRTAGEYAYVDIPSAGSLKSGQKYYIGALTDSNKNVSESNENNNYKVLGSFTHGGGGTGTDLVVSSGKVTGELGAGKRVKIDVTLKNQGTSSTSTKFYTKYYLSTDDKITTSDTYLGYDYTYGLSAGRTAGEYAYVDIPSAGSLKSGQKYYIGALTDSNRNVSESNENNNYKVLGSFTHGANRMPTVSNANHYDLLGSFAIAAYKNSSSERNEINQSWYGLSASDLGLKAKEYTTGDFNSLFDIYMKDGNFRYQNASGFVAQSVYNGKKTLILSFAGTDSKIDVLDDITLLYGQLNAHDISMKPLKDAVHAYVKNNNFDQVIVTGHSLGGAMVETFMKSHKDDIYNAVTFASPGVSVNYLGSPDSRITSFEREGDIVPDFPLEKSGEKYIHADYQGSIAWPTGSVKSHNMINYRDLAHMIGDKTDILNDIKGEQYVIIGNSSNDVLSGVGKVLLKNQYLLGFEGNDTLDGGAGNDHLYGGAGNDIYTFSRDDGTDTIVEEQGTLTSKDILQIQEDNGFDDIYDLDNFNDLTFQKKGNDLYINLDVKGTPWGSDNDEGTVIIKNQGSSASKVEILRINKANGSQIGSNISLASIWNIAPTAFASTLNLTNSTDSYGIIVSA